MKEGGLLGLMTAGRGVELAVEEVVVTGSLKAEDVDGSADVAVVEAAAEGTLSAGS